MSATNSPIPLPPTGPGPRVPGGTEDLARTWYNKICSYPTRQVAIWIHDNPRVDERALVARALARVKRAAPGLGADALYARVGVVLADELHRIAERAIAGQGIDGWGETAQFRSTGPAGLVGRLMFEAWDLVRMDQVAEAMLDHFWDEVAGSH
jgi:hypothetical protein